MNSIIGSYYDRFYPPTFDMGTWRFSCCAKEFSWTDPNRRPEKIMCSNCYKIYPIIIKKFGDYSHKLLARDEHGKPYVNMDLVPESLKSECEKHYNEIISYRGTALVYAYGDRYDIKDQDKEYNLNHPNVTKVYEDHLEWSCEYDYHAVEQVNRALDLTNVNNGGYINLGQQEFEYLRRTGQMEKFIELIQLKLVNFVEYSKQHMMDVENKLRDLNQRLSLIEQTKGGTYGGSSYPANW